MATNPPFDPQQQELEEVELQTRMNRIGQKILVLSGKGGVGKSTVATQVAMNLAREGKQVGLLDIDLHGPSIPVLLGITDKKLLTDEDEHIKPVRINDHLSVVSVGLLLSSPDAPVIWRGPMKYKVIRQFLKDVNWGNLDYLVIDSPPGTGDEPLSVAQSVGTPSSAVIVTSPQDLAIADVRRSITFCRKINLPICGIVENMSGLVCPHCNQTIELFKTGGGQKLADAQNVPFLGRIPLDPTIVTAGDDGKPITNENLNPVTFNAITDVVQAVKSNLPDSTASEAS